MAMPPGYVPMMQPQQMNYGQPNYGVNAVVLSFTFQAANSNNSRRIRSTSSSRCNTPSTRRIRVLRHSSSSSSRMRVDIHRVDNSHQCSRINSHIRIRSRARPARGISSHEHLTIDCDDSLIAHT